MDSGKASDLSVCSWPIEPIQWTPFPLLQQLNRNTTPVSGTQTHIYIYIDVIADKDKELLFMSRGKYLVLALTVKAWSWWIWRRVGHPNGDSKNGPAISSCQSSCVWGNFWMYLPYWQFNQRNSHKISCNDKILLLGSALSILGQYSTMLMELNNWNICVMVSHHNCIFCWLLVPHTLTTKGHQWQL